MRIRLLVLIVSLNSLFLFSQKKEVLFRHLNAQLSGYSVKAFVQDYKGFMWIGTSNGLNRYDGNSLTYYMYNAANKNSVSNNGIMALYESSDSSLWIATMNGLNLYNHAKNNFIRYYHKYSKNKNTKINLITDIAEDKYGKVWISTSSGICIVNKSDKTFETFEEYLHIPEKNYTSKSFNVLYPLKNGNFLAGNVLGDIYEFNLKNKTVKRLVFDNGNEHELDLNYITDICQTNSGQIWISSTQTGLLRIDKIVDTHVWYQHFLHNPDNTNELTTNNILSICVYHENFLLIGTENNYLNILDIKSNKFSHFSDNNENKYGIPQNSFWTIYKSKNNSYWIGTFSKGIYIIDDKPFSFKSFYHNGCKLKSLPDFPVTSFAEDNKGNMWIASDGGALSYWNKENNEFLPIQKIQGNTNILKSKAALCLYKTRNLGIWAGFYKGGIIIIDNKNKIKQLTIANGLSSNSISSIVENKKGVIFIGTFGAGVNYYQPKTGKINSIFYPDSLNDLNREIANVLYVDSKDQLLIGYGNKGFSIIEFNSFNKFKIRHYEANNNKNNNLSSNNVFAFAEDEKENIWIATSDGLNKLNKHRNKFTVFRPENNVLSNTIVGIINDNKGKLWLSTYNGIWSFDVKSEKFRQYTKADGIEKMRFNKRTSFYKNNKGEIYFGANGCFTFFNPDSINQDTSENKLYITNFLLFNKPVKIGTENSPLQKQISETKKITLDYNQSVFTLEYVAINYKTPEKINYAYKLDNFEANWNYVGKKRSATYTNLNPGKYYFMLKSTNAAGDWSKKVTVLEIVIQPPFWKTIWFYASIAFLVLLTFYIFYTEKTRRITIYNQLLEQKVKNRTQELKEVNTRLEEKNEEIFEQKEELHAQSEILAQSNHELEQKTNELLLHQNKLEELVKIRTAELEKAKLKAEDADRLKSAFLANMSHEIRTPMNAVVGFSQLLSMHDLDDETKDSYIRQIQANTDTLLLLIDDILDLSKIESGQITIEKNIFELSELLQEVYADNKVVHKNNKVELRLNNLEKAKGIQINSDRKRIKQILMNLFNNARKFTEEGFVELGFEQENKYLKFYIKDTGIGISKDELDEIFVRFKRIVDKGGKLFRGTGLGLSIAQKLAKLLDGKIIVNSELNKGSVFILILPDDIIVDKKKA